MAISSYRNVIHVGCIHLLWPLIDITHKIGGALNCLGVRDLIMDTDKHPPSSRLPTQFLRLCTLFQDALNWKVLRCRRP